MTSAVRKIGQNLGCLKKPRPSDRTVYVDNRPPTGESVLILQGQKFPNNRVISSKYTLLTFLPKNLFEQFRRIANFYFLTVGIIQFIIDSPVSPITSVLPLVFVVIVTGIKQGYEDWLRHKADNEVNNRKAFVIRDGKIDQINSMNIKVGDIVRVNANHSFPCDLVMLSSHDQEGMCYVTTANLDGETNLKTHVCVADTRHCQSEQDFQNLSAYIECQQPIPDLYKFVGRITVVKNSGEHIIKPLGPENVLLRGARLKNTPYIYGCAVYTGPETKMALNSKAKSTKFSRVEKGTNRFLIIFLIVLLLESLFSTIMKYWYANRPRDGQPWYVPDVDKDLDTSAKRLVENFLSFMVLYNYIIPISLYVTVEVQKFVGSMFFCWDLEMYDEGMDQPAKANTSDLNEELGQVEYLFTDKTGTLTENDMQFRQCSIRGTKYMEMGGHLCEVSSTEEPGGFVTNFKEDIENFLILLALCHTVRVESNNTTYSHSGMDYEYTASSPDEKAFVEACRRYGVVFHGFHDDRLEVTFRGEMRRYRMLHVLDFDPTRKRMSVIVQNEDDEIYLLCKGAETAVLDRVTPNGKSVTLQHVNDYAMLGLRTLVLARRKFTDQEYSAVDMRLTEAKTSLQNREQKLAEVYDVIERDMELLGATAVEDKLQDEVPKTISSLRQAGIKIWVLTGDKEETAVNISYSAGHFKQGMAELRLTQQRDSVQCAEQISRLMNIIKSPSTPPSHEFVMIVDGASLTYALRDHSSLFRELCMECVAVLCCRMSPLQKAEVVKLMKHGTDCPVTAAIGDGANDVSMIQEAHVGLGLMGKEGRQAVRNSDYAFAKFKFLQRVFLVHGHYYYIRLSTLVQYFFYKNVAFITGQLLYTFFSSYSQQTLFDSFDLMFYNITFTSLPVLVYSLVEQHMQQRTLIEKPHLYRKITRNNNLSIKNFVLWNTLGLWHTLVFFFGIYFMFGRDVHLFPDGKILGNWSFGCIIYTACIISVNLKLVFCTYTWNIPVVLSYIITGVGCLGMHLVYTYIRWPSLIVTSQTFYYTFIQSLGSLTVWIGIVVTVMTAVLPDIIWRTMHDIKTLKNTMETRGHSESTIPLRLLTSEETEKFVWNEIKFQKTKPDRELMSSSRQHRSSNNRE